MVRYRFNDFTLSPQRRLLVRDGQEVPLIPRYFDLLVLLIERRHEAVHRQEIFDSVWTDAVVSDSALSQAVRTLRRTLGDDSREPVYIRTVSRHGYRFVFAGVVEEEDETRAAAVSSPAATDAALAPDVARGADEPPAAERLAADEGTRTPLGHAIHAAVTGWPAAAAGGALAGVAAGGLGGLILATAPGSTAPIALAPVLAVVAAAAGGVGGAGVGAGLASADASPRANRSLALTSAAAIGGGLVGVAVQWLTRWGLAALVGLHLPVGGGLEGIVIGACAGLGIALATRRTPDGIVEARDGSRWRAAFVTAVVCSVAGLLLAFMGRPLAGGTINAIAAAAEGSSATLAPLGRLFGESGFGPRSKVIAACGECAAFGIGLAFGVLQRPARIPASRRPRR